MKQKSLTTVLLLNTRLIEMILSANYINT